MVWDAKYELWSHGQPRLVRSVLDKIFERVSSENVLPGSIYAVRAYEHSFGRIIVVRVTEPGRIRITSDHSGYKFDITQACDTHLFTLTRRAQELIHLLPQDVAYTTETCRCNQPHTVFIPNNITDFRHVRKATDWISTSLATNSYCIDTGDLRNEWRSALERWSEKYRTNSSTSWEDFFIHDLPIVAQYQAEQQTAGQTQLEPQDATQQEAPDTAVTSRETDP